jgi:hypothetical protein
MAALLVPALALVWSWNMNTVGLLAGAALVGREGSFDGFLNRKSSDGGTKTACILIRF